MLGMFLAAMEATVVSTAMPTIIAELRGIQIYSWVFSGYILTSTISVPIWGRLSDLYGRRRFYLIGIGIFLMGSVLSGLSQSMAQLIVFRAIQGLGAGALLPLGMTILGEIYSLEKRARMQGIFSAVWGLASIAGPLVGGFLTEYIHWSWVFYINIPFGLAAAAVLNAALIEPPHDGRKVSVDYAGIALLSGSMAALLLGLMHGGASLRHWDSPLTISLLVLSVILLVFFVGVEKRALQPLVPLALFRERIFSVSSANGFLVGMAMFGALSFIPLFIQGVIGTTATEAGTTLTPFMLSWVVAATLGGRLMLRFSYKLLAVAGVGGIVVGFALMLWLDAAATRWDVIRNLIFAGVGMGFCLVTVTIALQNAVPRDRLGIATSAAIFFRSIGGAMGVALMGAVLSGQMQHQIDQFTFSASGPLAERLSQLAEHPEQIVNPITRQQLAEQDPAVLAAMRGALGRALHDVFVIGFIIACLAFIVTLWLPGGRAADHRHESRAH